MEGPMAPPKAKLPGRMPAIQEVINFYTKHWPECSGADIACSCGFSQLKNEALTQYAELLEACKAVFDSFQGFHTGDPAKIEAFKKITAAIAKAEGR